MAVFFINPYVKYYDNFANISDIERVLSKLATDTAQLQNNVKQLNMRIDAARWKELGQAAISSNVVPVLEKNIDGIAMDVTASIKEAVSSAKLLYEAVSKLKQKDEQYEKELQELDTIINSEPNYYGENDVGESNNHIAWRKKFADEKLEISNIARECSVYQQEANSYIAIIKSLTIVDEVVEEVVEVTPQEEMVTQVVQENVLYSVNIPSNMAQSGYTVTGYDQWIGSGKTMVWAKGTNQRALSEIWKNQGCRFKNGIAVVNVNGQDRYLIATTSKYGKVGDSVTVHFQDGTSIPCIIADQKSSHDSNYNEYGHMYGNQVNILEFEVQRSKYLTSGNPNTNGWGLEWNSRSPVVSIDNNGSVL